MSQVNIKPSTPASGPQPGRTIRGSLPTPPVPVVGTTRPTPQAGTRGVGGLFSGTPGRMRLFGLIGVLCALVIGGLLATAALTSSAAADRAARNTEQVARVTSIHGELLKADALATNAFLIAGQEPADRRQAYDTAIQTALTQITAASAAQSADTEALSALTQEVQRYTSLVDQARAYNRVGLPVGAGYLTQASNGLRSGAIPILTALEDANTARAEAEFGGINTMTTLIPPLAALVVLGLIMVWLAKRTRRYVNPEIAAATVLLAAATFFVAQAVTSDSATASSVSRDSYARAVQYAQLRTAATDARANESLTLIARGNGQEYEKRWAADSKTILDSGQARVIAAWQPYAAAHSEMRALDDGGDWAGAVARVTGSDTLRTSFDTAAGLIDTTAAEAADQATSQLRSAAQGWQLPAIASILAALAGAWLIVRGMGKRIGEYR